MPIFNVESIEAQRPRTWSSAPPHGEGSSSRASTSTSASSLPSRRSHDPVALRELFSPGFLDWVTTIDREIDFGITEQQLYFLWRLRERTSDELELALKAGGELFRRVRREIEEHGDQPYPAGPWHAGWSRFRLTRRRAPGVRTTVALRGGLAGTGRSRLTPLRSAFFAVL